jgi:thiamine pyrophosphokinase
MLAEGTYASTYHPPPSEDFLFPSPSGAPKGVLCEGQGEGEIPLNYMHRIIILANGELPDLEKARSLIQTDDYIVCADGGTRHALTLGVKPNLIIGDMDSATREALEQFRNANVEIELFPQDKNETDLELAIDHALGINAKEIVIVGALGGRLDQTLANIALLTAAHDAASLIRLDDGVEEILLCRDQVEVHGRSGDIVSLIPWLGAVSDVETTNLKWPLRKETLYPDKTRGISNEMISHTASVSIGSGLLLVVHRRET